MRFPPVGNICSGHYGLSGDQLQRKKNLRVSAQLTKWALCPQGVREVVERCQLESLSLYRVVTVKLRLCTEIKTFIGL